MKRLKSMCATLATIMVACLVAELALDVAKAAGGTGLAVAIGTVICVACLWQLTDGEGSRS